MSIGNYFFIIGIIIVVSMIIYILIELPTIEKYTQYGVGSPCTSNFQCNSGLVCFASRCLIPYEGSCGRHQSMCAHGAQCINGECVDPFESIPIPESIPPLRIMTNRNPHDECK
jgi:hypothetical protein